MKDNKLNTSIEFVTFRLTAYSFSPKPEITELSNKNKLEEYSNKPVLSNENDIDYALSASNIKNIKPKPGGNKLIWDMRHPW